MGDSSDLLNKWWRQRGYEGNPLFVSAEDVPSHIWQKRLDSTVPLGRATPSTDGRERGEPSLVMSSYLIDDIIRRTTHKPVLIWGYQGSGKSFSRILATESCRRDNYAYVEITIQDLSSTGIMKAKTADQIAATIARCLYEKLCKHFARLPNKHFKPDLEQEELYGILARCGEIIGGGKAAERGSDRFYVFIDGLDRLYEQHRRRQEVKAALKQFIEAVAADACGASLAVRLFLPQDFRPLALSGISEVELRWSVTDVIEALEWWLSMFWPGEANGKQSHLADLLERQEPFQRELIRQGAQICVRDGIRLLSAVTEYAAKKQVVGKITEEELKAACKQTLHKRERGLPWCISRLRWALYSLSILIVLVALWSVILKRVRWTEAAQLVVSLLTLVLGWIAKVWEIIQAIVIVMVVLGGALFLAWCLWHSYRTREPPGHCLKYVWTFLRRFLPWNG